MFQLDDSLLRNAGLDFMPEEQKQSLLEHIFYELEIRVGVRLAMSLNDQKLDEFEKINMQNPKDAVVWLEGNLPGYRQIVAIELAKIQQEIIDNRHKILEA